MKERLEQLDQHPEYARAMRHEPKSSTALMIVVGVALTIGGGVFGVVAATTFARTAGWCMALGGVACLAVAVFFLATPLERVLALVADERIRTDRERDSGRTSRKHYVTLDRIDGEKREYRADRDLAERLEEGNVGVAYLKAGFLLDFRVLD